MPESDEVTVLIPEGYELRQIADVLEESGLINRDVFMREAQVGSFDYPFIDKIPTEKTDFRVIFSRTPICFQEQK